MTIEEYFEDWAKVIDIKEVNRVMGILSNSKERTCPILKNVFKAFEYCKFEDLRVVILGQDPYNDYFKGEPRATGIAFANSNDIPENQLSPSLEILKDSVINFRLPHGHINFDNSLEMWEKQGVLLLNSALTCLPRRPGSHSLLWRNFMKSFLCKLSEHSTGIVYILMGNQAQSFEPYINSKFNHIIKTKHPSWYARNNEGMPIDLWPKVNNILKGQNGYGIEWYQKIFN